MSYLLRDLYEDLYKIMLCELTTFYYMKYQWLFSHRNTCSYVKENILFLLEDTSVSPFLVTEKSARERARKKTQKVLWKSYRKYFEKVLQKV